MFFMAIGMIAAFATNAAAVVSNADNDKPVVEKRVIWVEADPSGSGEVTIDVEATMEDDGAAQQAKTYVFRDRNATLPDVWIGVRITPVPAPLAAHIGDGGVMISNVVVDSPADAAGIKQYDVVLSAAGTPTNAAVDLVEVVGQADPDTPIALEVVRGGELMELAVVPTKRDTTHTHEMKYDEPTDLVLNDAFSFRGHTLKQSPDGTWVMKELGPLRDLPDAIKKLERMYDFDFDIDVDTDLFGDGGMQFYGPSGKQLRLGDSFNWYDMSGDEMRIEVRTRVDESGEALVVRREGDNKIVVERIAPGGERTSAEYDSLDALEAEDPDAHSLLTQDAPQAETSVIQIVPGDDKAIKLRRQFQVDVTERVREALERAQDVHDVTISKYRSRMEEAQRAIEEAHDRMADAARAADEAERATDAAATPREALGAQIEENGSVTVYVQSASGVATYRFKSPEALKAADPELHAQVAELLD